MDFYLTHKKCNYRNFALNTFSLDILKYQSLLNMIREIVKTGVPLWTLI